MDINEGSINFMSTSLILEMDTFFILFVSLVQVVGITPTDNFLLNCPLSSLAPLKRTLPTFLPLISLNKLDVNMSSLP